MVEMYVGGLREPAAVSLSLTRFTHTAYSYTLACFLLTSEKYDHGR